MFFPRQRDEIPYLVHLTQTNKISSVLLHALLSLMWVFAASKFAWTYFHTDGDINRTWSISGHVRCLLLLAVYTFVSLAQLTAACMIARQKTFRELLQVEYIKAVVTVTNFASTMTIVMLLIGDEVPISTPVNSIVIQNMLHIFDNVRLKTATYLHMLNFLCFCCMEIDEYMQNPMDTAPLADTVLCLLYGSALPLSVAAYTECQSSSLVHEPKFEDSILA
ncbi:hypothetical protein WJX72_012033 [[Myrmecia] bisecta]|uniref:Uncharacterized protein n=1 Tax=[Myrmecia] bisecta TaxID=41462 RepID=A0AAW1QGK6_9CHLO